MTPKGNALLVDFIAESGIFGKETAGMEMESATRLRPVLGETPQITIREGLSRTLDWFRENVPLTQKVLASIEPENWDSLKAESWMQNLPSHGYKSQIGNE